MEFGDGHRASVTYPVVANSPEFPAALTTDRTAQLFNAYGHENPER